MGCNDGSQKRPREIMMTSRMLKEIEISSNCQKEGPCRTWKMTILSSKILKEEESNTKSLKKDKCKEDELKAAEEHLEESEEHDNSGS
ncbi:unnamed protein product [Sphagnum balticum]